MLRAILMVAVVVTAGCAGDGDDQADAVADCCWLWPDTQAMKACALASTKLCYCSDVTCTLGEPFTVCQQPCEDAGVDAP